MEIKRYKSLNWNWNFHHFFALPTLFISSRKWKSGSTKLQMRKSVWIVHSISRALYIAECGGSRRAVCQYYWAARQKHKEPKLSNCKTKGHYKLSLINILNSNINNWLKCKFKLSSYIFLWILTTWHHYNVYLAAVVDFCV